MDPDATYKAILSALANGNRAEALQSAQDLIDWLNRGGYAPERARCDFCHTLPTGQWGSAGVG